ncbi:hypothetical protein [Kineococcus esterisolvens]|uniref:hypothetical protein n=1 Tax=unclassified Kineococcus TaxID=2621656 RepID=UPI003D7D97FA
MAVSLAKNEPMFPCCAQRAVATAAGAASGKLYDLCGYHGRKAGQMTGVGYLNGVTWK